MGDNLVMQGLIDKAAVNEFLLKAIAAISVAIALEAFGLLLVKLIERALKGSLHSRDGRDRKWQIIRRKRLLALPQLLIRGSLLLLAIFIALEIFDLPIMPFAVWVAITSLVAVLVLRRLFENAVACYMLMLEDAVGIGDKLRLGNCWATVEHVGWFATRLRDENGLTRTVMNSSLMELIRTAESGSQSDVAKAAS
ncbi:MAG: mechanosensitive ion channel family protein [Armatimonadetes bacterium]|nr:mechanosensitive ion channel family protein [Armatimonadota bacterium]